MVTKRAMPCRGRDGAEDSRQGRLMFVQLPAGATVTDPGSVFISGEPRRWTARRLETVDTAASCRASTR